MKDTDTIEISCPIDSFDFHLFQGIFKQEDFPKSKCLFALKRIIYEFHKDEVPLLLNKLRAQGQEEYVLWAEDIELIYIKKFHIDKCF